MGLDRLNRAEELPESMRLAEEAAIEQLKNPDTSEIEQNMSRSMEEKVKQIERQAIAQGLTWSGARQEALGRSVEDIVKAGTEQMRADHDRNIQVALQAGQQVFATKQTQRDFALREAATTGYYGDSPVLTLLMQQNDFDQQKMMQAGYSYTDPTTNMTTRVLGIDERADKDFLREEDVRNGYSQVQTYNDKDGNKVVIRNPHTGEPILRRVLGTQQLQKLVSDEAARLQEKGIDADIAQSTAQLQWQKDQASGFWSTRVGLSGQHEQVWVTGSVGLEQERNALTKEMQELGFDQQTAERQGQEAYDDKIREGYTTYQNGKLIDIRGTQSYEEHIIGLQQKFSITEREAVQKYQEDARVGYDKTIDTGRTTWKNGKEVPVYQQIHIEGTQEAQDTQNARQDTLVRDGWSEDAARNKAAFENSEKQRTGYYTMKAEYDQGGNVIGETLEYVEGSQAYEDTIREDAQKHDISLEESRQMHNAAESGLQRAQNSFLSARADQLVRQGWTRADALSEAEKTWSSNEKELDRTLSKLLADKQIDAAKNMFDAEGHRELMNQSMGAIGAIGGAVGPDIIKYLMGGDREGNYLAPSTWTREGLAELGVTGTGADQLMEIGNNFLSEKGKPNGRGWKWDNIGTGPDGGRIDGWSNSESNMVFNPESGMAWTKGDPSTMADAGSLGISNQTHNIAARFGNFLGVGGGGLAATATGLVAAGVIAYGAYKIGSKVVDWWKNRGKKWENSKGEGRDDYDSFYNEIPIKTQEVIDGVWERHGLDSTHESRWKMAEIMDVIAGEKSYDEVFSDDNIFKNLEGGKKQKWRDMYTELSALNDNGRLDPNMHYDIAQNVQSLLNDGGVFDKPANEWTRGQRDAATESWDMLPAASRGSGDSFESKARDLAVYGSEMNIMSDAEITQGITAIKKKLSVNLDNVSVSDETTVNQIFSQAASKEEQAAYGVGFASKVNWIKKINPERWRDGVAKKTVQYVVPTTENNGNSPSGMGWDNDDNGGAQNPDAPVDPVDPMGDYGDTGGQGIGMDDDIRTHYDGN